MTQPDLLDFIAAEEAKNTALDNLERARKEWLLRARDVAVMLYRQRGEPISVVDVRQACPAPPEFDGRVYGAVFRTPQWRAVNMVKSGRRICHNRTICRFEYVGVQ